MARTAAITVVEATLREIDEAAALFDAYRVFYRQPSDPSAARAFLSDRFQRQDAVLLLARHEDAAVGFVQLYPSLSSVSMKRIWILNDLYVTPGARRLGVGRRLMDAAREHAAKTGAIRLELTTEHNNTTAQALYERCGYVRDTVFYKYILTVETKA
jgi:ribosomal protein S18 acetylase RimI-like enzyme